MLIGCSFELQTEVLCIGTFWAQIAQHIRTFGTVLIPADSASDQELWTVQQTVSFMGFQYFISTGASSDQQSSLQTESGSFLSPAQASPRTKGMTTTAEHHAGIL